MFRKVDIDPFAKSNSAKRKWRRKCDSRARCETLRIRDWQSGAPHRPFPNPREVKMPDKPEGPEFGERQPDPRHGRAHRPFGDQSSGRDSVRVLFDGRQVDCAGRVFGVGGHC